MDKSAKMPANWRQGVSEKYTHKLRFCIKRTQRSVSLAIATRQVIHNAENVVLIGWPKTGKSHVTVDIDVQAIKHHSLKVRFCLTVELATALEQEKVLGKAGKWPMWHPNRLGHP